MYGRLVIGLVRVSRFANQLSPDWVASTGLSPSTRMPTVESGLSDVTDMLNVTVRRNAEPGLGPFKWTAGSAPPPPLCLSTLLVTVRRLPALSTALSVSVWLPIDNGVVSSE